jgi:hypothetical protein
MDNFRECRNCGPLPLSMWRHTRKGLICIPCRRIVERNNYNKSKGNSQKRRQEERYRNASIRNANYKLKMYVVVDKLKSKPCVDCGFIFEPWCMDFDHIHSKTMSISGMISQRYSMLRILEEINKTELVCVLCHRSRTHARQTLPHINGVSHHKNTIFRNKRRELIRDAKSAPCSICGKSYDHWMMDLDHVDPSSKILNIANSTYSNIDILKNEIGKCRALCALCHRRITIQTARKYWEMV